MVFTDHDRWVCFGAEILGERREIAKGEEAYFSIGWHLCPACFQALAHGRVHDPLAAAISLIERR